MRVATAVGAVGAALVAGGLALFISPEAASLVAGQAAALQVVGTVALLVAAAVAVGILRADDPVREALPAADPLEDRAAGWAVDRALDHIDRGGEAGTDASSARERVREELRAAVRDRYLAGGVDRATAERRIDDGAWTDDDAVAAFLAEGRLPDPSPPERVRLRLRGESRTRWIASRAVDEVERFAREGASRESTDRGADGAEAPDPAEASDPRTVQAGERPAADGGEP